MICYSATKRAATSEAQEAPTKGDTGDSVGATEENQVEEKAVHSNSTDHPVQNSVEQEIHPFR